MSALVSYFKKRPQFLILGLILLIGLFFRTYKIIDRFEFAHDGDLYSWIVKDILVNHHIRLIGQLTSAPGIFIGPLFYYLLVPFFLISNMDPIGVTLLGLLVGTLTILSYYFILSKIFNKTAGLIAAFLHAVSISMFTFDRWIVPTLPTKLWAVWYLYVLFMVSRGKFSYLPILGILVGLIWHIHIALLPALIAVPVAFLVSKKLPALKQTLTSFFSFMIVSIPLILFEIRHGFIQVSSLINNLMNPVGEKSGISKLLDVINMIGKNTNSLFLEFLHLPQIWGLIILFVLIISVFLLARFKQIKLREFLPLMAWVIGVIVFFSLSRTPISEYYFANMEVIFVAIVSLLFSQLIKTSQVGSIFVIFILGIVFIKNFTYYTETEPYRIGYLDRKATVNYITEDAKAKGYPCIGITYITRIGENVGFRYFFYLKNTHLVHPSLNVPVYNIVIPEEYSKEVVLKFGHIGIIPPNSIPSKQITDKSCQTPNTNLTDPLFGYVE